MFSPVVSRPPCPYPHPSPPSRRAPVAGVGPPAGGRAAVHAADEGRPRAHSRPLLHDPRQRLGAADDGQVARLVQLGVHGAGRAGRARSRCVHGAGRAGRAG